MHRTLASLGPGGLYVGFLFAGCGDTGGATPEPSGAAGASGGLHSGWAGAAPVGGAWTGGGAGELQTGGTSGAPGVGGGATALDQVCAARCAAALECPESPWGSRDECQRECLAFHEPDVPAECSSLLVAVNECVVTRYAECEFGFTEVCAAQTEPLGACVRGAQECENREWRQGPSYFEDGIYHQWACQWAGPTAGAAPGEPCVAPEDCAVVVCPCADTGASYALQVCSPEGNCATDTACAEVVFRDWLCGS